MPKRAVNVRIEEATIERFDLACVAVGRSRTSLIEEFMRRYAPDPDLVASENPPPVLPPSVTREELRSNGANPIAVALSGGRERAHVEPIPKKATR